MDQEELDRLTKESAKRLAEREERERKEDTERAEKDRQAYLRRTGRTELKP